MKVKYLLIGGLEKKKNLIVLWYYFVEEWYRAATLLVFPLARTEGATLELIRELLYHARGKPKSRLKVFTRGHSTRGSMRGFMTRPNLHLFFPHLGAYFARRSKACLRAKSVKGRQRRGGFSGCFLGLPEKI